jgi:membrane protease YdiL (CAAX protease family)
MILPILFVYALTRLFWEVSSRPEILFNQIHFGSVIWLDGLLKLVLWVVPTIVLLRLLRRESWRDAWSELGLLTPAWTGSGLMLLSTLPMAALPILAAFTRFDLASFATFVVFGPVAEEVLYRGFLFQQLWHRARWPVWGAALGSSIVFALAHHRNLDEQLVLGFLRDDLYASLTVIGPPMLAAVAGGCLFAWITWRWRSLWPAIALHGAVNFWWDISIRVPEVPAAVAQSTALAVAVGVTLTWRKTARRDVASLPVSPPVR